MCPRTLCRCGSGGAAQYAPSLASHLAADSGTAHCSAATGSSEIPPSGGCLGRARSFSEVRHASAPVAYRQPVSDVRHSSDGLTCRVARRLRPWLARLHKPEDVWQRGLDGELDHWRRYLTTQGDEWPDEYRTRLDPQAPLADELTALIDVPDGAPVRILDVGAGPLTILGKVWAGHQRERDRGRRARGALRRASGRVCDRAAGAHASMRHRTPRRVLHAPTRSISCTRGTPSTTVTTRSARYARWAASPRPAA